MNLAKPLTAVRTWLRTRRERDLPTAEALAERDPDHDAYIRKNAAAAAGPTLIK